MRVKCLLTAGAVQGMGRSTIQRFCENLNVPPNAE